MLLTGISLVFQTHGDGNRRKSLYGMKAADMAIATAPHASVTSHAHYNINQKE